MADAMEKLDSRIMLAIDAIKRLKAKDPEHELLQWGEGPFFLAPLPKSFMDRFGGEHISEGNRGTGFAMAEVYYNYYKVITEVLGEKS